MTGLQIIGYILLILVITAIALFLREMSAYSASDSLEKSRASKQEGIGVSKVKKIKIGAIYATSHSRELPFLTIVKVININDGFVDYEAINVIRDEYHHGLFNTGYLDKKFTNIDDSAFCSRLATCTESDFFELIKDDGLIKHIMIRNSGII